MSAHTTRRAALAILATTAAAWRHAHAQAPAPLRIGFQKGSLNLALLKSYGLLEQRLPGTRIQWTEFPAGPQLLEALALGSVDLGATGDAPPTAAGRAAAGRRRLRRTRPHPPPHPCRRCREPLVQGKPWPVPRGDGDARRIDRRAHRQAGPAWERPGARPANLLSPQGLPS